MYIHVLFMVLPDSCLFHGVYSIIKCTLQRFDIGEQPYNKVIAVAAKGIFPQSCAVHER